MLVLKLSWYAKYKYIFKYIMFFEKKVKQLEIDIFL